MLCDIVKSIVASVIATTNKSTTLPTRTVRIMGIFSHTIDNNQFICKYIIDVDCVRYVIKLGEEKTKRAQIHTRQ